MGKLFSISGILNVSFSPKKNTSYWLWPLLIFPFLTLGPSKSKSQEWGQEGPVYSGLPLGLPAQVTAVTLHSATLDPPHPRVCGAQGGLSLATRVKPQTTQESRCWVCVSWALLSQVQPCPHLSREWLALRDSGTEQNFKTSPKCRKTPTILCRGKPATAAPCLLKFQRRPVFITANRELPIKLEDTDYFEGEMKPFLVKINHFKSKLSVTFFF